MPRQTTKTIIPQSLSFSLFFICITLLLPVSVDARATNFERNETLSSDFRILSRSEWGADESLGIKEEESTVDSGEKTAQELTRGEKGTLSEKERLCQETVKLYPGDFRTENIDTQNENGKPYVWPRRYSPEIKLLVIHHTGEMENGNEDNRPGIERVRAIYKWHTAHNGWGDIGYHYLIDREGEIYEGRAGGDSVVGGHAYCANVETIGIALIGNFLRAYPSEDQLKSLRFLLSSLSKKYELDPNGETVFRGKRMPTIVAHRDVGPTQCAGRFVQQLLSPLRRLTAASDFTSDIVELVREEIRTASKETRNTLTPIGSTRLTLPPRGAERLQLTFTAGEHAVQRGASLANITRSHPQIALWHQRGDQRVRVRGSIVIDQPIKQGKSTVLDLTILAPPERGKHTLKIGNVLFTLEVSGRGARTP